MFQDKPEWIAHQRKHWLRPDAERWLRPDAHRWMVPEAQRWLLPNEKRAQLNSEQVDWTVIEDAREQLVRLRCELRSLRTELKLQRFFRALKAGFNPNQARLPAGSPGGGQWTGEGGTAPGGARSESAGGAQRGHHFVPRQLFDDPALRMLPETKKVFEQGVTGPLNGGAHRWDQEHRIYNKAVAERFRRFLDSNRIRAEEMTPDQARRFLDEVRRSSDPRIRGLNMKIYMREIIYWFRRVRRAE
jgi:hypothetical protein